MNKPKSFLENYTISRNKPLGKGAFGEVCIAVKNDKTDNTNSKVAVKIISSSRAKCIQRELELLKKLDHPNIVKFLGYESKEENSYIFMELCDGGNLTEYMKKHPQINIRKLEEYFYQMVKAGYYFHSNKCAHRDIKPDNILLNKGEIKIADFGLGRTFDIDELHTYVGTPIFMSPQVYNLEGYTSKCDIW
jgi:serine/threonine protein kinase